jgi:thioredoxin-related protein
MRTSLNDRLPTKGQSWLRGLGYQLIAVAACVLLSAMTANADAPRPGKVVGGEISEHPGWFKESFLDIAEDAGDAAAEGRHVMLFLHLNGCPYCYKMIEENIKNAPYTGFIKENFDVIALNIRGDREVAFTPDVSVTEKVLAERLKVNYTPTIIFLDGDNKTVARVNGYRSVEDFRYVLDYVVERAYQNESLAAYLDQRKSPRYSFRASPIYNETRDLRQAARQPLAVVIEDKGCRDCNALYDGHFTDPEVRTVLNDFTVVRLDALSDEPMIDPEGKQTTVRAYVQGLGLTYRPGIVLYDRNREIWRIESRLYRYHFTEILRYVGERHHEQYPDSFYDYLDVRTAELTAAGQDVDLGEQKQ